MNIKKIAAFLAAAALVTNIFCFTAAADTADTADDDLYIVENSLWGYYGEGGDIVIPEGVTEINKLAFHNKTEVKSVTFEGDMENIGVLAFLGCSGLERVTFKGDINEIDECAFMGCQRLKTVKFAPNSRADIIKRAAFSSCAELSEVKLPNEVGKICEFAFSNCPKLTRLEIPSMTELEPYSAGYMYDEPTEEYVKADGAATVQACLDYEFALGEPVLEEVRQKPITLVVAPGSPAEKYAKENGIAYEYKAAASPKEDFVLDGSVITGYTGKGGDVVIPEGITEIDTFAFDKCTALKSVTFEGDIERVGALSFCGCTNLERVTFKGSVFGNADSDDFDDSIGWHAFAGCTNLKTVEFAPNSRVDIIRRSAFKNCASLSEVKLPNEVGKICECAFSNCPKLTRLEIPSMTELEPYAAGYMYDDAAEEHVKADGSATVQTMRGFYDNTTEELRQKPITLVVTPNSPAEKYAKENDIAYEYKAAASPKEDFVIRDGVLTGYRGKGGDVVIPEGVTEIDGLAFQKNSKITSLVIPKGCTKIEASAFYKCTALKSVTFEGDMEAVGLLSFCGCTALERVTFMGSVIAADPDDAESGLSFNAFMGCKNLKTVEFAPNSRVDIIKRAVFMDCASLSEVKLPGEVGKICEAAFANCPELTRLEIPSMTELEPLAVGYMYDEPTEEYVKADGIVTVQAGLDFDDDEFKLEEVRQKPITLVVAPGSPAEKYAEENGIAYEYKNAAAAPDSGSTQSPKTGGESTLPPVIAAALSLTVMIFTRTKKAR